MNVKFLFSVSLLGMLVFCCARAGAQTGVPVVRTLRIDDGDLGGGPPGNGTFSSSTAWLECYDEVGISEFDIDYQFLLGPVSANSAASVSAFDCGPDGDPYLVDLISLNCGPNLATINVSPDAETDLICSDAGGGGSFGLLNNSIDRSTWMCVIARNFARSRHEVLNLNDLATKDDAIYTKITTIALSLQPPKPARLVIPSGQDSDPTTPVRFSLQAVSGATSVTVGFNGTTFAISGFLQREREDVTLSEGVEVVDEDDVTGGAFVFQSQEVVSSGDVFDVDLRDVHSLETSTFVDSEISTTFGFNISCDVKIVNEILLGDMNGDGCVTLADVGPFVAVLNSGSYNPAADIDRNGTVDLADVSAFLDIFN